MNKLSKKVLLFLIPLLLIIPLWSVFIVFPLSNFLYKSVGLQNNFRVFWDIGLVSLLIVIPVLSAVFFIINSVFIKPLTQISLITRILSMGNLEKRIGRLSDDEIGLIGENIDLIISNLISSLQSMIVEIKKNKDKELILAKNIEDLQKSKNQIQAGLYDLSLEKSKLQALNAKDHALLSSIGEAVVGIDSSKKIFIFNSIAGYLCGITPEEAIGKNYSEILHFTEGKEKAPVDLIEPIFLNNPAETTRRIDIINKNGKSIPVSKTISPIKEENTVTGVVLVFRDITTERELEKQKNEFMSIASHELRTPMTAIKGLVSMILEGDYGGVNDELKDPLSDVFTQTNRLIDLVNDMLDVSRIEMGRLKIAISEFKISDVVNETLREFSPIASKKGLELKSNVSDSTLVSADIDKIRQILSNLLGNSLKFTDSGSLNISSKLEGDFIKIYVADTGIGIAPDDIHKLFSKFAQISSSQAGRPQGTGLGLYISKQLCQTMGGDLWAEKSIAGVGTTFAFSLPLPGTVTSKQVLEKIREYDVARTKTLPIVS